MNINVRPVCALIALVSVGNLLGCEDSAAKQRDAVQESLSKINLELQVAMASAGATQDDIGAGLTKLNQVITQLQQVDGGEPWQQASKAMLGAMASREIADIYLAEIDRIESRHRDVRLSIRQDLDAALGTHALVTALAQVDGRAERESLQRELDTAKAEVSQLSETFMKLGEPIARQTSANDVNLKEAERLRTEVSNLLRRAQELGPADGFDTYKQASQISRQADEIEFQIAQREIELDYQLTPEHKMVATQVNELQAMIGAIEAAQAQIDALVKASVDEVAASRNAISQLTAKINTSLDGLNQGRSGELATLYGEALAALEKAQSQVDAATGRLSGEDAQTSRLLGVRTREALGRLHWSQARALADHRTTLELLVNGSKELGASGTYAQQLGETSVAYDQAIEKAREHYAQASEQLASVQSRVDPAAVMNYQQNLNGVISALEGKTAPPATESSSGDSSRSAGAESAEALVATIKNIKGLEDIERVLDLVVPPNQVSSSTPGMQALFESLRPVARGIAALDTALKQQFNKGLMDVGGEMAGPAGGMPDLSQIELVSSDEQRGTIRMPGAPMGRDTIDIVQINGRWFIDPKLTDDLTGGAGARGGAPNPQAQQMADAMMQNFAQTIRGFGTVIGQLTQAVEAGQYASIDEFKVDAEARFKQAVESSMFGGMMQGIDQSMKNRPNPRRN